MSGTETMVRGGTKKRRRKVDVEVKLELATEDEKKSDYTIWLHGCKTV